MAYTNSSLVSFTQISPNRTKNRNHAIDTITIHCVVGQCTVEALGAHFSRSATQASANYGVGYDGRIGLYVEEKDRSWCSSNAANDNRAVTIEVASDTSEPFAVTDKALNGLIELIADICKRNGIKELKWKGDKSLVGKVDKQNMTVHRWFAPRTCPGTYLYEKHPYIAEQVNKILGASKDDTPSTPDVEPSNPAPKPTPIPSGRLDSVKGVQSWANANYKAGLVVDGIYGANTKRALVKILQTELNQTYGAKLVVDGVWGPRTKAACPNLYKGTINDVVKVLQALLVCNGYSSAYIDGNYGTGTCNSVISYQKKKGLVADGIAGQNTFSKLCG